MNSRLLIATIFVVLGVLWALNKTQKHEAEEKAKIKKMEEERALQEKVLTEGPPDCWRADGSQRLLYTNPAGKHVIVDRWQEIPKDLLPQATCIEPVK